MKELPLIDVAALRGSDSSLRQLVSEQLFKACTEIGFFYIVGHGIPPDLEQKLTTLSQSFFAQNEDVKMQIRMELAGRAWRGYFPLGGELTSGKPDWKEGLYFGKEHSITHPEVIKGTPLHGQNLFPPMHEFRETVLAYIDAMAELAQSLLEGIALSLDLDATYFRQHFTQDPTELFRIFHYPPPPKDMDVWGVGEHTDYGLLTILKQDDVGGLEVKSLKGWIQAPPIAGSFVCNIGDMLDRLSSGLYRSTPHRVKNTSQKERYSFPYFFDPSFNAPLIPLPLSPKLLQKARKTRSDERWDQSDIHKVEGTYGDYLLKKVGKVFPELKAKV